MLKKLFLSAITTIFLSAPAHAIETHPGYFSRENLGKVGSTYQVNDNHLLLNSIERSGNIYFLAWRNNNLYRVGSNCSQFRGSRSIWYVESHPSSSIQTLTAQPGEPIHSIVQFVCN
jgi:hypothetical protein